MDPDRDDEQGNAAAVASSRKTRSVPQAGSERQEAFTEIARCLLSRHLRRARSSGHPVLAELRLPEGDLTLRESAGFGELLLDEDTELVGYSALPQSDAIAVVATGNLRSLDPSVEPPAALASLGTGRVELACVVARDGGVGWFATAGPSPAGLPAPSEGRLLDCLRRAVGVPTPPPTAWPSMLEAPIWVANIRDLANRRRHKLSWSEALQAVPDLPSYWYEPPREGRAPGGSSIAWELLRIDVAKEPVPVELQFRSLSRLRQASPMEACPWLPCSAVAAWMDAGVLSRWVKDVIPPPHALAASVTDVLTAGASRRLGHSLNAILA